jgi:cytochrome c553
LKPASLFPLAAAAALLAAAVFARGASAQAPQGPPPWMHEHNFPKPTNLKVLPKDLNGKQVREIMEKWAGSLGVHCDNCHAADPHKIGRNGKPELDFPSDAKPAKNIARLMYTMTQQINHDYIGKAMQMDTASDEGAPVTCGTCHRGQKYPPEFVIPKENRPSGGAAPR